MTHADPEFEKRAAIEHRIEIDKTRSESLAESQLAREDDHASSAVTACSLDAHIDRAGTRYSSYDKRYAWHGDLTNAVSSFESSCESSIAFV